MWISTEYGISCFDRETKLFENYFFSTNVLGNIYTENCGIRLPDGRLAFGTNYGLNIIHPESLVADVGNKSVVTFTDLKLDGVSVRPGDAHSPLESALPYLSEIKLQYYQNSFVIDFSTLDYVRQGIQQFSYRLDGYEKAWSKPSPLSFAAYKNLRPGTYRLRVKASNSLGIWSEKRVGIEDYGDASVLGNRLGIPDLCACSGGLALPGVQYLLEDECPAEPNQGGRTADRIQAGVLHKHFARVPHAFDLDTKRFGENTPCREAPEGNRFFGILDG